MGQFKNVALDIAQPQYLILLSDKIKFVAWLRNLQVEEWPNGWTWVKPNLTIEVSLLELDKIVVLDKVVGIGEDLCKWIRFVTVAYGCLDNFINLVFYKSFRNVAKKFKFIYS